MTGAMPVAHVDEWPAPLITRLPGVETQRVVFGMLLATSSPICLPIAVPTSVELR